MRIWETDSGWESSVSPLQHRKDADLARFSPNGEWLATVTDNEVRVWRFADLREAPLMLTLPGLAVGTLSPTGKWAAAGSDTGEIAQWQTTDGAPRHPNQNQGAAISALDYSPTGNWLASGDVNGGVRIWEAATGRAVIPTPLTHEAPVTAVTIPREGIVVVAAGDELKSWTLPGGELDPV